MVPQSDMEAQGGGTVKHRVQGWGTVRYGAQDGCIDMGVQAWGHGQVWECRGAQPNMGVQGGTQSDMGVQDGVIVRNGGAGWGKVGYGGGES